MQLINLENSFTLNSINSENENELKMSSKPSYEELEQRIAQLEQEKQLLKEQSIRDPLTGLYNRQFYKSNIENILAQASNKKQDIGVLFIDIDKFKYLNDNFGHAQGDKTLRELARIIESSTKSSDYAIRWGGEEIIVLLQKANGGTGKAVTSRINAKIDKHNQYNKIEGKDKDNNPITYTLTISAGYARRNPESTEPMEHTIKLADDRMYEEKRRKQS